MASVLPARTNEVEFEISAMRRPSIRDRGGQLWIWPSPDRSAYATTELPGDEHEWTDYRQAGFVVHVDDAIVPPQRWVVALPRDEGRHLDAWWNGADPREAFGRLPLLGRPNEEPEPDIAPWWAQLVFGGSALLVGVFWVLGIAGLHRWWFKDLTYVWEGVGLLVVLLAAAVLWAWRRFRRA